MNKRELEAIISTLPAVLANNDPFLVAIQIQSTERMGRILLNAYNRIVHHVQNVRPGDLPRYMSILNEIDDELLRLGSQQVGIMNQAVFNAYTMGYEEALMEQYRQRLIPSLITHLDPHKLETLYNWKWNPLTYSDRVWNNKEQLREYIQNDIMSYVLGGTDLKTLKTNLAQRFDVAQFRANTLVRTETMAFYADATMQKYKDNNITSYKYLAKLDSRTSKVCQAQDGKEYLVHEALPGVNYPPLHPNCRSTTVPASWFGNPL